MSSAAKAIEMVATVRSAMETIDLIVFGGVEPRRDATLRKSHTRLLPGIGLNFRRFLLVGTNAYVG